MTVRKNTLMELLLRKIVSENQRGIFFSKKNPTCWLETYSGGLDCCHHNNILLDADQPVDNRIDEIYLKFRFYYQPYVPAIAPTAAPSHKLLHRFYFTTEAFAGEYDVVKCDEKTPPTQCIQEITARFTAKQMFYDCNPAKDKDCAATNGIQLIYAGAHCHAPSCLSMELYNADTGALLCRQVPAVGTGSNDPYDEFGYISIPPCLWGYEDGLIEPTTLFLETNLLSIKRNNNTYGHFGEMASWQMRGVIL